MTEQTKNQRFKIMVLPHLNAAYNLARWLTRDDQDAEDVTQEACLRAFKFFDSFRGEQGRAWLLGIVRNTFYTRLQKNRGRELNTPFDEESHSLESQDPDTPCGNPESILSRHDDLKQLNGALESLPVEFREAVVLKDLEDLSYKEIADVMAVPIGTVMSRLARGRKLLRACLANMKQGDDDGM
ncbi:MAG: sigma-70 family RNA polymerase sigma factor [Gammaproteobacteria bacterium]|nr:sigma-70 family RNA polymerase sigma factor [Gammaproteobacteria bacterium]